MASITGTSGDDLIHVAGDNEELYYPNPPYNEIALATNAVIYTDPTTGVQTVTSTGNDTISGSGGDDVIFSGTGFDTVNGNSGNDIIHVGGAQIIDPDGINRNGMTYDGYQVVGGGTITGGNGNDDITAGYDTTIDGNGGTDMVHLDLHAEWDTWVAGTILYTFNELAQTVDLSQAATGSITLNVGGLGSLYVTVSNVESFDIVFGGGNDVVTGSTGNDILTGDYVYQTGNDTISGNDGNDVINGAMGADVLNGGLGNDTIDGGAAPGGYYEDFTTDSIHGNGGNDTLTGGSGDLIEGGSGTDSATIRLAASTYSYTIDLGLIDGSTPYDFGDETSLQGQYGSTQITHGTQIDGVEHIDELDLGSGNDTVTGAASVVTKLYMGGGDDSVTLTGTMPSGTMVDGGAGNDILTLNGDYSTLFTLDFASVDNVETIALAAGHDYNFVFNVFADEISTIDASALGSGDTLTLNASEEANSVLAVLGGAGDDSVNFGNILIATQHFDGGAGNDTLTLSGNITLAFGAATIANVETLDLSVSPVGWGPYTYNLTLADGNVASGATLTIDGSALGSTGYTDTLTVDGHLESDGHYVMLGGAFADTLTGGAQSDTFTGGAGADTLKGNGGADTFVYTATTDSYSAGSAYDRLVGFDPTTDKLDLWFTVNAIDAPIVGGTLNTLHSLADASHLGLHDALLFTATNGNIYVIVDSNGTAGYQTDQDLVIRVDGGSNLSSLSTSTFV